MDIKEALSQLIAFKTETVRTSESKRALKWVREQIQSLPWAILQDFEYGGFPSLIATTRDTKNPAVWLAAHIDVVPAPDALFSLREQDGKLYARGAYDMKFAIAAYLSVLHTIGTELPKYNIGLMLTADEETGGFNGTDKLLNEAGYRGNSVILPDGGTNWAIENAAKGVWMLAVKSDGVSAHSSRPWEGDNAITKLSTFLAELSALFVHEPCNDKTHFHSTCNVGVLSGGETVNKIPDSAEARVDIRFTSEQEHALIEERVNRLLRAHPGISIETDIFAPPFYTDPGNYFVQAFTKAVHDITGATPQTCLSHGASDARFFGQHGITVIVTRPHGGGHHANDEWIDTADLERFADVIRAYLDRVAKS